jgi:putative nucleotidyltransferase with HDIG domain
MSTDASPSARVARILRVYEAHGDSDYIGEAVSSVEHALQAAALAAAAKQPDAVVAGALLHDVGHLLGLQEPDKYERMGSCGVMAHEGIGAAFLERRGFPAATCDIVRNHVQAKRYLCWKDAAYHARLSAASKTTLGYQGGPMAEAEAREFEADPGHRLVLLMRTWDEAAKVPGADVPGFEAHREMLERIVRETLEAKERAAAS